jgi:hypothetical protein
MSIVTTARAVINCDALGCRWTYQGTLGCDYAAAVRSEARVDGWRVNVPRERGPSSVGPLPFVGARLDFCPRHRGCVG